MTHRIKWKSEPEHHDYQAASDYLSLIMQPADVHDTHKRFLQAVEDLKKIEQPQQFRKAKDLLRASGLPLLPRDNYHVSRDLEKIEIGEYLSPLLCVAGNFSPLIVADGYHRICACYWTDENTDIALVLV